MSALFAAERPQHRLPHRQRAVRTLLPQALPGPVVQQPKEPKLPALFGSVEPNLRHRVDSLIKFTSHMPLITSNNINLSYRLNVTKKIAIVMVQQPARIEKHLHHQPRRTIHWLHLH